MKPKTLNIYEMWNVYRLLGQGTSHQEYLIDEAISIMKNSKRGNVRKSLDLMYDTVSTNPLQYGLMLIRGLKKNNFFIFQDFIEGLRGRS